MARPWQTCKKDNKGTKTKVSKGCRVYTEKGRAPRKNGNIDWRWGVFFKINGKRREFALGWESEGWTESKVKKEREKWIDNARKGLPATPTEEKELTEQKRLEQQKLDRIEDQKNITFQDFASREYFPVAEPNWKPETARKHREHCKNWLYPTVGNKPFKSIILRDLNKIKASMQKKKRAARTMQAVFRTFDMIWTYARDVGIVSPSSPTKKKSFKLPKIKNERERFLTFDEAERLLQAVQKRSQQAYDMALLSLHSGMRFSEVARMHWQHVDFDNHLLRVFDAKGNDRILEMSNHVIDMFEAMKRGKRSDLVFPNTRGEMHNQVPSSFKRAIDDARLNDDITDSKLRFGFHGLRHTRASWLRKSGADLYTIQRILGHSTPVMTQRYSHIEHEEISSATAAVDRMLEADKSNGKVVSLKKRRA